MARVGRQGLNDVLMDLREGRIDLARFFQLAEKDIQRMADALYSRWVLPPGVSSEDLCQEMRVGVLMHRWDLGWVPGTHNKKGALISISVHFNWRMHVHGKRWLHEQRGAHRRSGHAMSEFPICMAYFRDDEYEGDEFDRFGQTIDSSAAQEQADKEVILAAYDKLPFEKATAWAVYVAEGDEEQAAIRIDASAGLGSACHASTITEARKVVKRAVKDGRALARAMNASA